MRADQHGELARRDFARDDSLEADDDHRGEEHWVDGDLRHRPVRPAPPYRDPKAVGCGQDGTAAGADQPCLHRYDVLGKGHLDRRYELREPVGQHGAGTVSGLLGRLEDGDQGAAPLVGPLPEDLGGRMSTPGPMPLRRIPTTPVPPTPVWTRSRNR